MRALSLATLALTVSGCKVRHDPGYESPMDTVLTYQGAFAAEDLDQEYRCLSTGMKRDASGREGYVLVRDRIFEPLGALGRWVLRRNELSDNLIGAEEGEGEVMLGFEIVGEGFAISLTREDRIEIELGDDEEALVRQAVIRPRGERWRVLTDLEVAQVERLLDTEVRSVTLRGQWKIAGLHQPAPMFTGDGDAEEVANRGAGPGIDIGGIDLPWKRGAESLGVIPVEFILPRPNDPRSRPIVWRARPRS